MIHYMASENLQFYSTILNLKACVHLGSTGIHALDFQLLLKGYLFQVTTKAYT